MSWESDRNSDGRCFFPNSQEYPPSKTYFQEHISSKPQNSSWSENSNVIYLTNTSQVWSSWVFIVITIWSLQPTSHKCTKLAHLTIDHVHIQPDFRQPPCLLQSFKLGSWRPISLHFSSSSQDPFCKATISRGEEWPQGRSEWGGKLKKSKFSVCFLFGNIQPWSAYKKVH